MESTRRSFLKGLGLATAGLILLPEDLPRRFWALGAPLRLWGDGIHDDAPALRAIFNGRLKEVINAEQYVWQLNGITWIGAGHFRMEDTVTMPSRTGLMGSRVEFGPLVTQLRQQPLSEDVFVIGNVFYKTS